MRRRALPFRDLFRQIERTVDELNAAGIGRGDRVAMVLPNGPEAAVCCLAVAAGAASAPLNPAYSAPELEFYLADLKPKALILDSHLESPALGVANSLGIPVLRLVSTPGGMAGVFRLEALKSAPPSLRPGFAEAGDVALILHTSGSTSRPKMVPLTHSNLCASAAGIHESLGLTPADRCLNIMPLFHIHGLIGAILSSLSVGASVICSPGFHAANFFDWMDEFEPTWYTAVPTMHQAILGRLARGPRSARRLRFIRSCSSALPPKLMAELESAFGVPVVEAYGMTEASHQIAVNPQPPLPRKPASVGLPTGCQVAIMSEDGGLLPAGAGGEIVIRGANVTLGYEGAPEANRIAFTDGWLRTGDQGRIDSDGYLFLTGRTKEIINRGGEKISPREIDDVLMDHPCVAQSMAFAIPDDRLGEDIGAAIVLKEGAEAAPDDLREFAAARLADFKIPRRIVFVSEIPKGPTGKPQRIGLAAKLGLTEPPAAKAPPPFLPPRTPAEERLAGIWRDVLGIDRLGIHDDFFQLGGDSILAAQFIVRVRSELGIELPMFRLFNAPTIAKLAEWIESARGASALTPDPIAPSPRNGPLPLSFSQQRMWFLAQFEEEAAAYVLPIALRIRGALSQDALHASLQAIVKRHEILRTIYPARDGAPSQVILPHYELTLPLTGLTTLSEPDRESRAREMAREEAHRPFDLSREAPLRVRLLRFDGADHVLLITIHHIATDGWSKSVFFRELAAFYEAFAFGSSHILPDLPIQYADYALWRRQQIAGDAAASLVAYWKDCMAGCPPLLELPADRARPSRQSFSGGIQHALLPPGLRDALRALSRGESATLFMTLLAAFETLLSRYSAQTDFCVGTPMAHRVRKETEGLIGPFLNTLPIRADLSGDPPFRRLLARVRETALGAYDHQELPLERLIEIVQPERSLSYSPLFQVMFQLRNFPEIVTSLNGLSVAPFDVDPDTAQFDLSLDITESNEGLSCALNYNAALFDRATAQRMLGHYRTLLESAAQDPDTTVSRLALLTTAERRQLLVEWNETRADYSPLCVHEILERQAALTPQAIAATCEGRKWTYAELNRQADLVGQHLRGLSIGPDDVVALYAGRSLEMLAALIGIWKAGASYVALDPGYPAERLAFIFEDSCVAAVLTEERYRDSLPAGGAKIVLLEHCRDARNGGQPFVPAPANRERTAFLIYTSGSTGKPKGVLVSHSGLTNVLASFRSLLDVREHDVMLASTTISFDIAALELFMPLIAGARIVIASRDDAIDGHRLAKTIEQSGATLVQATPSGWRMLIDVGWAGRPGIRILSGGETLPGNLAKQLAQRGRVWNAYGPTETTIYSTATPLAGGEAIPPIGRPIANTEVYVVDAHQQPVPVGIPGELLIGGDGVAIGYRNRPGITAEKFIANPFREQGSKLYRSGDLVRYLPDGNLEFLRRSDNQVKIRGFRIELGEVEAALREHPGVRAAAARVVGTAPDDKRLIAYCVPRNGHLPSEFELRDVLRRKLPSYMLPSEIVGIQDIPLTPSGKVDRNALAPFSGAPAQRKPIVSPRDPTETLLAHIWEDELRRSPIGIDEDFFDLGGHSLLGARLLAHVEKTFGTRLTLMSFFEAPTIARMAELLRAGSARVGASLVIGIRSSGSRPPLFVLHPPPLFRPLLLRLPQDQPIRGLSVFDPSTLPHPIRLEDIAARQIDAILAFQPEGPFVLAGWCADGVLACEMAQQLRARGRELPLLVMFDSFNPARDRRQRTWATPRERLRFHLANMSRLDAPGLAQYAGERLRTVSTKLRTRIWRALYKSGVIASRRAEWLQDAAQVLRLAVAEYTPRPYDGPVLLIRAQDRPAGANSDPAYAWRPLLPNMQVADVPGTHQDLFTEPCVQSTAVALDAALPRAARPTGPAWLAAHS